MIIIFSFISDKILVWVIELMLQSVSSPSYHQPSPPELNQVSPVWIARMCSPLCHHCQATASSTERLRLRSSLTVEHFLSTPDTTLQWWWVRLPDPNKTNVPQLQSNMLLLMQHSENKMKFTAVVCVQEDDVSLPVVHACIISILRKKDQKIIVKSRMHQNMCNCLN